LWQVSDDRVHRWRCRRRAQGTLVDRAPGGGPVHGILPAEVDAIVAIAERWGPIDRSHRKLAHRGSYEGLVWVAPSTFRRVLAAHGLVLSEPPVRSRTEKRPWPEWLRWEPNRIWIWDVTHFSRAHRAVFAIVDMVSRRWIDTLVSVEETATQVVVVFEHALAAEGLLELLTDERLDLAVDDPARPILLTEAVAPTAPDLLGGKPLVEPVDRHDRPPSRERSPERRLLMHGLRSGVSHPVSDLRVLRPRPHQTTPQRPQLPHRVGILAGVSRPPSEHDVYLLRRGSVVRRF
jgi:hypothetical protein